MGPPQPNRHIFILHYEDLVGNPDSVQEKIGGRFGLIPAHRFSDNALGIRIFKDSVDKWQKKSDLYAYLQTIPRRFRPLMHEFFEEFGDLLPPGYATGYVIRGLENGENPAL